MRDGVMSCVVGVVGARMCYCNTVNSRLGLGDQDNSLISKLCVVQVSCCEINC